MFKSFSPHVRLSVCDEDQQPKKIRPDSENKLVITGSCREKNQGEVLMYRLSPASEKVKEPTDYYIAVENGTSVCLSGLPPVKYTLQRIW